MSSPSSRERSNETPEDTVLTDTSRAVKEQLTSQFNWLDQLANDYAEGKLSHEYFLEKMEDFLRKTLPETSKLLRLTFNLLEGKPTSKESTNLRLTLLQALELMYRWADKLGLSVGIGILDSPQALQASQQSEQVVPEPTLVSSWNLDKKTGMLAIAGQTIPQDQFSTSVAMVLDGGFLRYKFGELSFRISSPNYQRLIAELSQFRQEKRRVQPSIAKSEANRDSSELTVASFVVDKNQGIIELSSATGQTLVVHWQEIDSVLKRLSSDGAFLEYLLHRHPNNEVVSVRVSPKFHNEIKNACIEMASVDWLTLVTAYAKHEKTSPVILNLQSRISNGELTEARACIELQEKCMIYTPKILREKYPRFNYYLMLAEVEAKRNAASRSQDKIKTQTAGSNSIVNSENKADHLNAEVYPSAGTRSAPEHASHDRAGSRIMTLRDGSKMARFVVTDGSGGALFGHPRRDQLTGGKMQTFVDTALKTAGGPVEAYQAAANEVRPSVMLAKTGEQNMAYGVGVIMDVSKDGIRFVAQGDVSVLLFNPRGDFATRRTPKNNEFSLSNLGNPSRFQQLCRAESAMAALKEGEPSSAKTASLDNLPEANGIYKSFGQEQVDKAKARSYTADELSQLGARYALIVTDGAEPNAIIDSDHAENERIANLLIQSASNISVLRNLPKRYQEMNANERYDAGQFLLKQIKYQKRVVAIMDNLASGGDNITAASQKIANASREILGDTDDITVQIIDLADFMPTLREKP